MLPIQRSLDRSKSRLNEVLCTVTNHFDKVGLDTIYNVYVERNLMIRTQAIQVERTYRKLPEMRYTSTPRACRQEMSSRAPGVILDSGGCASVKLFRSWGLQSRI